MKITTISMEDDFHRKVKVYCAKNRLTIKELFIESVKEKIGDSNEL